MFGWSWFLSFLIPSRRLLEHLERCLNFGAMQMRMFCGIRERCFFFEICDNGVSRVICCCQWSFLSKKKFSQTMMVSSHLLVTGTPPHQCPWQSNPKEAWRQGGSREVVCVLILQMIIPHQKVPPSGHRGRILHEIQPGDGKCQGHLTSFQASLRDIS